MEPLTPHQLAVVEFLAAGLSNQAIAARLSITPRSVDGLIATIYSKLDCEYDDETRWNRRCVVISKYFRGELQVLKKGVFPVRPSDGH